MKLLLDENLSYRIISPLQDTYPGTTQVRLAGLEQADDRVIWSFAKENDYVIVTKDDDFQGLLGLTGYPPKVIRLLTGNCSNEVVINTLLHNADAITVALEDPNIGFVEIY
jgi:predicted nuclease of predicted toxin-antitoxin system